MFMITGIIHSFVKSAVDRVSAGRDNRDNDDDDHPVCFFLRITHFLICASGIFKQ